MALYRLSLQTISRGAGRSALAAAAYRSGTRLLDSRTAQVHDYTRRAGVVRTALLGWAGTREALWNAAEAAERRKDSVVAREVQLALPHELPALTRWRLAVTFGAWLRERYGVAVDLCLHRPGTRGDQRNHHAHLLFTTRVVEGDTFGAKTTVLDHRATGSVEVELMRATWATLVNDALQAAGSAARVEHRSYARQGVRRPRRGTTVPVPTLPPPTPTITTPRRTRRR
jgi:hypothetical protein